MDYDDDEGGGGGGHDDSFYEDQGADFDGDVLDDEVMEKDENEEGNGEGNEDKDGDMAGGTLTSSENARVNTHSVHWYGSLRTHMTPYILSRMKVVFV